jgi:hypothetical protein
MPRAVDFSMLLAWFLQGNRTWHIQYIGPRLQLRNDQASRRMVSYLEDKTEFVFHKIITWQEHLYSEEGKRFQLSHFDDKDELEHNLNITREFINSSGDVIGVLGEDVHKLAKIGQS